jgi:carbon monoxide dehydrogenase subunit G
MKTYESEKVTLHKSAETVYAEISDFTQLIKVMPPQVSDWKATPDECSFSIQGLPTLSMKMVEKTPPSFVKMTSAGSTPVAFSIEASLEKNDEQSCTIQFVIRADINPMLSMMLDKPLNSFVSKLAEKAAQHYS